MKYILYLWIVISGQPVAVTTSEHESQKSCIAALEANRQNPLFDGKNIHGVCTPK